MGNSKKTFAWLVKYYPIIANINLLVLMILQFWGIDLHGITGYIVGCVLWPTVILIFLSKYLHFCTWHRVLLYNVTFYSILGIADKAGLKLDCYIYLALISSIITIIVSTILFVKEGCYRQK